MVNEKTTKRPNVAHRRQALKKPLTREATVNLKKRLYGLQFKLRASKAMEHIKTFAQELMGTKLVKLDQTVNQFIWSHGIRHVPHRIRVRLSRKKLTGAEFGPRVYTLVQHVPVDSFKGLETKKVSKK